MSNPYDQVIRTYRDEDEVLNDVHIVATYEDAVKLADHIRESYRLTKYGNYTEIHAGDYTEPPPLPGSDVMCWSVVHDFFRIAA
jgi:hypothetical protein